MLHEDDAICNTSSNPSFHDVLDARLSRRGLLGGGAAVAATAVLSGAGGLVDVVPAGAASSAEPLLGFAGLGPSDVDAVQVPKGYSADVLISWGDPVSDGPAFAEDASNSAADQAQQWGMHNDGVVYFPFGSSSKHGLLVQNSEYTDDVLLFSDGVASWTHDKTMKSQNAHGVNVIEIKRTNKGGWQVVRPSSYARRLTAQTPMTMGGPIAGSPMLRTAADPTGKAVLGTVNNCAMGFTPWGTYLACEENFNGYFRNTAPFSALETRYGVTSGTPVSPWYTTDPRWDVDVEPNEPNRFGWVVELDPFDPDSTPVKRTALGRLKHEGAWVQETKDGRVVVYMGDDQINEYIYRYVSNLPWKKARKRGINPLDDGVLYVAKFNEDGTGSWIPLTTTNPLLATWSLEEILVDTRTAADVVGATKMDRPEWIDTFPSSKTAIATLTNHTSRSVTDAPNPRGPNPYGHIIRWSYEKDFDQPSFWWDIYALCGDPAVPAHGSTIVGDKYGSPDGLYVAPSGRLWIQTDVSGSTINAGAYAGFGNNQMLCSDPATRETRRFLVGPRQCEVTGVFVTPDEKTMFVGIQHPGEAPSGSLSPANPKQYSSWPGGLASGRPRSSVLVITKDGGGKIGS